MRILDAPNHPPFEPDPAVSGLLGTVSEDYLCKLVARLAIPRHYTAEPESNRSTADLIEYEFASLGYRTRRIGSCGNILATPPDHPAAMPEMLLGAHYDSVPGTPGADDNASAVAGMLAVARAFSPDHQHPNLGYVAFNREEDQLFGSREFVSDCVRQDEINLNEVHVLEMIGYCDHSAGSQRTPAELPVDVGDTGDFIAVVCNDTSNDLAAGILDQAAAYLSGFPVKALQIFGGQERLVHHVERSDHSPFWHAGIPATMWTDTAEFRNPNYHEASDTPATLDYGFLRSVVQVLIAYLASRSYPVGCN